MSRAKYLPPTVSRIVKETGAHFMCILSKAAARGVSLTDEAGVRAIAVECVTEGKEVPIRKFLKRLGLRT
ncbi:MAG: hypothetical protein QXW41_08125 [Fervidicoccaceae archaeon]